MGRKGGREEGSGGKEREGRGERKRERERETLYFLSFLRPGVHVTVQANKIIAEVLNS